MLPPKNSDLFAKKKKPSAAVLHDLSLTLVLRVYENVTNHKSLKSRRWKCQLLHIMYLSMNFAFIDICVTCAP
jgi:hypothetical protein